MTDFEGIWKHLKLLIWRFKKNCRLLWTVSTGQRYWQLGCQFFRDPYLVSRFIGLENSPHNYCSPWPICHPPTPHPSIHRDHYTTTTTTEQIWFGWLIILNPAVALTLMQWHFKGVAMHLHFYFHLYIYHSYSKTKFKSSLPNSHEKWEKGETFWAGRAHKHVHNPNRTGISFFTNAELLLTTAITTVQWIKYQLQLD